MSKDKIAHNLCYTGLLFFLSYQIRTDDNYQHGILRRKSVIDETDVTIIVCLHVLQSFSVKYAISVWLL